MKKIFLILNVFVFSTMSSVCAVSCKKIKPTYIMNDSKDFDLKSFTTDEFQSLTNAGISENKNLDYFSTIKNQIETKVLDTIFQQIMGKKTDTSDEIKAIKEINWQIIDFKFDLINKNQQLRVSTKINEWKRIENFYNNTAYPKPNRKLIKGLANFGLDNLKKYYDHIKGNSTEFTIEYGDKSFYSSIENIKKILEEDNEKNIDNYQFYEDLDKFYRENRIVYQLESYLKKVIKDLPGFKSVYVIKNGSQNNNFKNDLLTKDSLQILKFEANKSYQTVIELKDKNDYKEYVQVKFVIKDVKELINQIKQLDFDQIIPSHNNVESLSDQVENYIRNNFKKAEIMRFYITVLNEQQNSELQYKEYTLNVVVSNFNLDFQIKLKTNFPNK